MTHLLFQRTITLFYPHLIKSFRVSRGLVKDLQRFGQFSHKYFKSEREPN